MRTIVVDDENGMLKRFKTEAEAIDDLKLIGSFENPQKALKYVAGNRVELAFLNMEMSEMNSLELADKLREIMPEIIIVFVSAQDCSIPEDFQSKQTDCFVMTSYSSENMADAIARAKSMSEKRHEQINAVSMNEMDMSPEQIKEAYENYQLRCQALRKRSEILRDSEELYRTALGLTNHTVTIIDIPKRALCQIYNEGSWSGVQSTMDNAPESIIETGIIHPDTVEAYRAFYEDVYHGSKSGECSIRVLSENGHWFWFTMYYQTIFDEDGEPQYAICFSDDLTSMREAEMMEKQFVGIITSEAEFSWEANITKDSIIREDAFTKQIIEGENFSSYSQMNEIVLNQIVPEDRERIRTQFDRNNMMQNYYDGVRELHAEYRYRLPNSEEIIWMESVTYLVMNNQSDICAVMTACDINERKIRENDIHRRAEMDALCDVYRRNTFDRYVKWELEQNNSGSLFMIDVDNFKGVNDVYGHLFGDQVLKDVASAIKSNFRSTDYVGRYGGDEFVVFMVGRYKEQVLEASVLSLMDRIRGITYDNGYKVSISVGVAQDDEKSKLGQLYQRADDALYQAKEKGKHTYCIG